MTEKKEPTVIHPIQGMRRDGMVDFRAIPKEAKEENAEHPLGAQEYVSTLIGVGQPQISQSEKQAKSASAEKEIQLPSPPNIKSEHS